MENFDNTNTSPEQGQEEVSAEERLGQAIMESKGQKVEEQEVKETTPENNQGEQSKEESTEKQQEIIKVAGQEYTPEQLAKQYEEARKRLSQRSEKEKAYEQLTQRLQQNPKLAKAIQLAAQDENFQTVIDLYEKGHINKQQLEKAKQYLQSQSQSQSMSNQQVNPEIQNKLSQLEQYVQNMQIANMKSVIKNDFSRLKENYGEVIENQGLDEESLTEFAVNHNFTKQTEHGPAPDIEQALVAKIASNQDALKQLVNMGKKEVQKSKEQAQKAQVESSSTRQQQQKKSPEMPEHIQAIFESGPNSGSGF